MHPTPSLKRAAVGGLGWNVIRTVSSRLAGSLVFIFLARLLDPDDFGTVAFASVFVVLVSVLVESGFGEAIVQRDRVSATELNSAFWVNNALGLTLALVLLVSAETLSEALGQPELAAVLQVLSVVFLATALASVPQALLRRELAFRALAVRGLAATLAGGLVGIGMALAGAGVWSLVGQMVTVGVVGTVLLWVMTSWRPGRTVSAASLVVLLRFSARIVGERLATFVSRRSDDFLIGLVLGPVALGLYTLAYRPLLILTETIIWTMEGVAFPLLSRLQNEAERRRRAFYTLTGACTAVAVPSFLALSVLGPEITRLAFGARWAGAIPVMQTLALVGIPHSVAYCIKAALNAQGRPEVSLRIALLTCVVNLVGFALVVRWGILAVAASYTVMGYVLVVVSIAVVVRVLELEARSYLLLFVAPIVSGLVMVVAVLGSKTVLGSETTDVTQLAGSLVVGAAVYAAMLCLTARRQVRTVVAVLRGALASRS